MFFPLSRQNGSSPSAREKEREMGTQRGGKGEKPTNFRYGEAHLLTKLLRRKKGGEGTGRDKKSSPDRCITNRLGGEGKEKCSPWFLSSAGRRGRSKKK